MRGVAICRARRAACPRDRQASQLVATTCQWRAAATAPPPATQCAARPSPRTRLPAAGGVHCVVFASVHARRRRQTYSTFVPAQGEMARWQARRRPQAMHSVQHHTWRWRRPERDRLATAQRGHVVQEPRRHTACRASWPGWRAGRAERCVSIMHVTSMQQACARAQTRCVTPTRWRVPPRVPAVLHHTLTLARVPVAARAAGLAPSPASPKAAGLALPGTVINLRTPLAILCRYVDAAKSKVGHARVP
jgi:hypothetical protein